MSCPKERIAMIRKFGLVAAISCCLLGFMPSTTVAADEHDEVDEAESERCIRTRNIRSTQIIDDQNVLFYMRGGQIYSSRLPRRCAGLRSEGKFSYKTTSSQLCDIDGITVLYDHGLGLTPGVSCRLGRFVPISEEEAEVLKNPPPPDPSRPDLPTAEPEEIGEPENQ